MSRPRRPYCQQPSASKAGTQPWSTCTLGVGGAPRCPARLSRALGVRQAERCAGPPGRCRCGLCLLPRPSVLSALKPLPRARGSRDSILIALGFRKDGLAGGVQDSGLPCHGASNALLTLLQTMKPSGTPLQELLPKTI